MLMTNPLLNELGLPHNYPHRPEWEVTPREVKRMLDADDEFLLLDCRTPQEYDLARIEGAVLLPLGEIRQRVGELEDKTDVPIVVHCHHGQRSLQMTLMLRQAGFADVRSMAGGIDLWSLDIDRTVPRY
jgi:rhodanese-related sulfurtransferase